MSAVGFAFAGGALDLSDQLILPVVIGSAIIGISSGLYTGNDKEMIFFVVVTDAYDTYGEGWKALPDRGDINPE